MPATTIDGWPGAEGALARGVETAEVMRRQELCAIQPAHPRSRPPCGGIRARPHAAGPIYVDEEGHRVKVFGGPRGEKEAAKLAAQREDECLWGVAIEYHRDVWCIR